MYEAIMKAADSIEKQPDLFHYNSVLIPNESCGTPGCAIGCVSN